MLPSIFNIMWPMHQQSLMLLHPTVKEKMHLQENTLFDLDLWGQGHMKCCPVPSKSCDLCTYRVWSYYVKGLGDAIYYKKIHYLTFDLRVELGVKVTQNVAQYPLHHMIYSATKFEVAMSNGLVGDTFTRNTIEVKVTGNVAQYPLHHVTYSAATFEVAMYNGLGGDTFTREYFIWPLTLS